jgi:hypothetical protein
MSQDNFSGGFLLGTLVGGLVGGLLGAAMASGRLSEFLEEEEPTDAAAQNGSRRLNGHAKATDSKLRNGKSRQPEGDMENARRSLEDKIAQLNDTIDDVRRQLGSVPMSSQAQSLDPAGLPDRHA